MKKLLSTALLPLALFSGETIVTGFISSESKLYQTPPSFARDANHALTANLGVDYAGDDLEARLIIETLQDSEEQERNFTRIKEGYLTYNTENMQFRAGREILFWGAMEINNPSDVINSKDLAHDLFNKESKIGAYLTRASYYLESSQLDIIAKWHEDGQALGDNKNPYFGKITQIGFSDSLTMEKEENRPTLFLKYAGSTEHDAPLDYAVALMSGYDNIRTLDISKLPLTWKSYLVNKLLTFNTWVVDATLIKFEATYADISNNDYSNLSDYAQTAIGFEHTLEQLYNGYDLGVLVEHNQFFQFDDKRSASFNFFNNDLFIGARLSINDEDSSSILGGVTLDLDYTDQYSTFIALETKVLNTLNIDLSYQKIVNSKKDPIASQIGDHTQIGVNLTYHIREEI